MSEVKDAPTLADTAIADRKQRGIGRRRFIQASASLGAAAAFPRFAFSQSEKKSPLAGKSIHMQILGVAGWLPSKLGVDMSPEFAKYAKSKYGYDVSFSFADAPFGTLFQKAATSLATRSQEYNIIISDSQWLGALATPGWIAPLNDIIAKNPELNIEWWSPSIRSSYQVFPDGTDKLYGLPQVGDIIGIFVRKDILEGPGEAEAFKAKHGRNLPTTWEDFEKMDFDQWVDLIAFFDRPEKGYRGFTAQYSRDYDAATCPTMSFMRSLGGDVWDPKTGQIEGILDTPSNAHAMELYKSWLKYQPPGSTNNFIAEVIDAFTQGKVFAAWQWVATGKTMIPPSLEGKVIVVPPPGFKKPDGTVYRNYIIGGQPWVINAFNDPDHMQVAVDFMKWWYLPDTSHEYLKLGGMPCDKATCARPDFDSINPWNRTYKYMLLRSSDFWHDPKYSEMLSDMQEAVTGYYTGQVKDPLHALKWVACQQQKILYDEVRLQSRPWRTARACPSSLRRVGSVAIAVTSPSRLKRRGGHYMNFTAFLGRREVLPSVLIAPVVIFFIVWNTIPTLWLIGLSFYRFSLTSGRAPIYAGFYNYVSIFHDSSIWFDLSRTFIFVIFAVCIETIGGFFLGLLFWGSDRLPGRRVALTLLFAPMVVTPVAAGTFWRLIYDPTFGVLNWFIALFGGPAVRFLSDANLAFWAVLAVDIWMWTPFMVLMALAGLASVPRAELEAAEIDHLTLIQRFRLVILYHGKFILMLGILLCTIDAFKTMDLIFDMTYGGPGTATKLVAMTLFRSAFESFNMGSSSALAVILLLISIAFTATFLYVLYIRERRAAQA